MGMAEVPFLGYPYTWNNCRQEGSFIEERLYRFFSSPDWTLAFPQTRVKHIPLLSSDHFMILLSTNENASTYKKRFYFDTRWVKEEGFTSTVEKAWNLDKDLSDDLYAIQERIKNVRVSLLKLRLKKVSDLLNADGSSWDKDLIDQSFSPEEASLILNTPLNSRGQRDTLSWHAHKLVTTFT
ncbi:DNA recombination protein RmuC homolog [Striga asiatica]|uniref:DNA recombination protein RmuC homolog n=1 Tax=Striga asiatica TaxID=4170 RepID=A0A5A7QZJ9_STRAF|nr:DNA recombination protein RmuC homolog [Striga asiatica]